MDESVQTRVGGRVRVRSGQYVITYGNGSSLYALKGLSNNKKYESSSAGGAVVLSSTGMTLSGSTLTNVGSAYTFTITKSGLLQVRAYSVWHG